MMEIFTRRKGSEMSDRFKGLHVAFEHPIRDDDAEAIISAIRQLRGVADVTPFVDDHTDWMNRSMIRLEFRKELFKALEPREGRQC